MSMHARDASGRRVSLLNDEVASNQYQLAYRTSNISQSQYYPSESRSISSSPHTPELLRSDSYDSQMSSEPLSPLTPHYDYGQYPVVADHRSMYEDYSDHNLAYAGTKRPSNFSDNRSESYDDDTVTSPAGDRPGKRYPCRYRDSHHCEKTFTTSGHASRHSKIHTAEKAVPCSFQGCHKKFTRSDNMKQHLDTHYKDKARSSSRPSGSLGDRRSSSSGKSSSSRTKTASSSTPLPSPGGVWDLRELSHPLPSHSSAARNQGSGLDTLALAASAFRDN